MGGDRTASVRPPSRDAVDQWRNDAPLSVGERQLAALPLRRPLWLTRRGRALHLLLLPRFGLRRLLTFLTALLLPGCGDTIFFTHRWPPTVRCMQRRLQA